VKVGGVSPHGDKHVLGEGGRHQSEVQPEVKGKEEQTSKQTS
jgi:hypothetical protein